MDRFPPAWPLYGLVLGFCVAFPALAAGPPANPVRFQDGGTARSFVGDLYRRYGGDEAAEPRMQGRAAAVLACPALLALIRNDRQSANGEAGAYDGDPLCDCQDTDGMLVSSVSISNRTASHADAEVALRFTKNGNRQRLMDLSLERIGGKWRIDDITDRDHERSLAAVLGNHVLPASDPKAR